MFMQVAALIRHHYPNVEVVGEIYPPPPFQAMLSQMFNYIFIFGLIITFTGDLLLNQMGMVGDAIKRMRTDYPYAMMIVLFFSSQLSAQLVSTGAFEIMYNDSILWSTIQNHHLPSQEQILDLVRTNLPIGLPTNSY
eukprot:TRINITY_DN3357_c0_g1_i1.p1 TRINITY_DN3357_c0_g1~~TRINITY_DN3357_c0_g1_i1.p1  ORF type:complete len:137 (+),score=25.80 TRINITY_DN3357_c0_g1_i1:149-559(+)